ncbi:MAG: hypothetical protein K0S61_428 [Anaerocolumna sp.]|jgi:hypothetical protein|nr:hypothetical protein [Anaerocolumna sp.]
MQIETKKKLLITAFSIIALFLWIFIYNILSTLPRPLKLSPYNTIEYIDDLYLSTYKDTYEKHAEINIYIHNETSYEVVYGPRYSLELYKDNKWYIVPHINEDTIHMFTDIAYILEAHTTKKEILYLNQFKLKKGHYRYVKEIQDFTTAVEFYIR